MISLFLGYSVLKFVHTPLPIYYIKTHSRAEWLINEYGRAHALFHAVRLGNSFITPKENIELKIEHNVNKLTSIEFELFKKKLQSPWASNLPLPIFTKLITEGYSILNDQELATKGNDMELFHFLSAGPLVINFAPQKLFQNIKDLIIYKKFSPRPKPTYEDTVHFQLMQARAYEEYSPKDGYENSHQLNVVARAIFIHPDLVLM
ncbi:hypothetical protein RhiirA5_498022 [Rhizophagus irregularis]|uniref:Uncharacterized protein n=1 Tax=Rhizophagus irregularis TaxID=588596 RepID=A0A2N0PW15_9GLOM|nr:hypothetical protein RhiirA5_498022 [Rhizophagus irregularis]